MQVVEDECGRLISLMSYDLSQKNAKSFVKISNWMWDGERSWKKTHRKSCVSTDADAGAAQQAHTGGAREGVRKGQDGGGVGSGKGSEL
jgi:hypothetical protein